MRKFLAKHGFYIGVLSGLTTVTVATIVKRERTVGQIYIPFLSATAPFSHYFGIIGLGMSTGLIAGSRSRTGTVQAGTLALASGVALWQGRHQIVRWGSRERTERGQRVSRYKTYGERKFRLFVHNVLMSNRDMGAGIGAEIQKVSPDVVFLVETNEKVLEGLNEVLSQYPYRWEVSLGQNNEDGGVLASRFPINDVELLEQGGRPCVSLLLSIPNNTMGEEKDDTTSHTVRFIGVHTVPPTNRRWGAEWVRQLNYIYTYAKQCLERGEKVIIAGDFNATVSHAPFRRFLNKEDFVDISYGIATWPKPVRDKGWRSKIRPVLALDHVLIGGESLAVSQMKIGQGTGSDHAPIICDIELY